MATIYTHTTWWVIPGHEAEFELLWRDWADYGHQVGLAKGARLLRSADEEGVFVSFGVWRAADNASAWRSTQGYHDRLARIQAVIRSCDPRTLTQVQES